MCVPVCVCLCAQAANPGCVLEDFVRWYSPRDYVEEAAVDEAGQTVIRGALSVRMKIPGNMWVEAWDSAKTTPARRQKRLFDDTKEAEKVRTQIRVISTSHTNTHTHASHDSLSSQSEHRPAGRGSGGELVNAGISFVLQPSVVSCGGGALV